MRGRPPHAAGATVREDAHDRPTTRRRGRHLDPVVQGRRVRRRDRRGGARGARRPPGRHRGRAAPLVDGAGRRRPPTGCSRVSPRSPSAASSTGWCCSTRPATVVRPALLWNDTRSAEAAADLVDELGAGAWADATGVVPVAATTVSKLRWVARHEPESLARARTCVLPHDWLTGHILEAGGGERSGWTTDAGDASGTGYWSAGTRDYRLDLLRHATDGVDLAVPRVAAPSEVVGRTASGIAVAAGHGRQHGRGARARARPGDVVVSLGTSGTAFAAARPRVGRPHRGGAVVRRRRGRLPAARLHAQRRARAHRRRRHARHRPRRARPAGPRRRARARAASRCCRTSTASARPTSRARPGSLHGLTRGNATPENLARAVVEGMLLRARRRRRPRAGGRLPGAARCCSSAGRRRRRRCRRSRPTCSACRSAIPAPGEYVAAGAARQAAWALAGGERPPVWDVDVDVTVEPADVDRGAEVRERYAAVVAATHPTAR